MTRLPRPLASLLAPALAAVLLGLAGCGPQDGTEVAPTPDDVIRPEAAPAVAPDAAPPVDDATPDPVTEPAPAPEPAVEPEAAPEPAPGDSASTEAPAPPLVPVDDELPAITYDELLSRIAAGDAKLTLVDCWASWCEPCKENFPHVIQMADAYTNAGLKAIALSFDAGTEVEDLDLAQVAEAKKFLAELDLAKVENLRHGQLLADSFVAFNVTTIPAVFLFDADGKEVARFTWDDPANQFSYDQVEAKVAELLGVESKGVVPAEAAE